MPKTINHKRLRGEFVYLKKKVLADACGVPPSNVSRWLAGDPIPRKHYKTISKITGVSLRELCQEDR